MVILVKFTLTVIFNTKKSFSDIQASLTRIDTTDAGREINGASICRVYYEI
jgi:hypothetical protein